MILDAHAHIGNWGDFYLPEPGAAWLVRQLDRLGVARAGVSHMLGVGIDAREGNQRALAAVEAHPDRLAAWLVADPHDRDAVAVLRDQLAVPGVWGLKLHPSTHLCHIADPRYDGALDLAAEIGCPVLIHTMVGDWTAQPADLPKVADRRPGLPLLMGHSGLVEHGFDASARIVRDHPDVYAELCGSRMTTRWLERIVAIAGAAKVVYGSDASFLDPRVALGRLLYAELSEDDRALVGGGTVARLLGERLQLN